MQNDGTIDDIQPFAELAQNATTVVYKAYQSSLDRYVLLKRLRREHRFDEDLAARFQEEARLIARIQHPNIVAVYSCGRDDEGAYILAEFVDGVDLGHLIGDRGLPAMLAGYILLQCATGLKAAHEKDVLHRDLKPSNILISFEGDVKIADFGMASAAGAATDGGEVRGTLAYLAPEQVSGAPMDGRSDLFSLGAVYYEMLTGRRAFIGGESGEILDAVLNYDPLPILNAVVGAEAEAKAICGRLLAKMPDQRYQSAAELVEDLSMYEKSGSTIGTRADLVSHANSGGARPDSGAAPPGKRDPLLPSSRTGSASMRGRPGSASMGAQPSSASMGAQPSSASMGAQPGLFSASGEKRSHFTGGQSSSPTTEVQSSSLFRIGESDSLPPSRRAVRTAAYGAVAVLVVVGFVYAGSGFLGRIDGSTGDQTDPIETSVGDPPVATRSDLPSHDRSGTSTAVTDPSAAPDVDEALAAGLEGQEDANGTSSGASVIESDIGQADGSNLVLPGGAADVNQSDQRLERREREASSDAIDQVAAASEGTEAGQDVSTTRVYEAGPSGTVEIRIDPAAAVFIDGDSIGTASDARPLVMHLEAGHHELRLRNPFFPAYTEEIVVHPQDTMALHVSLYDLVGRLELLVHPWAVVYVDGDSFGVTPFSSPLILRPGVREVRLVRNDLGIDVSTPITIEKGKTLRREVDLGRMGER